MPSPFLSPHSVSLFLPPLPPCTLPPLRPLSPLRFMRRRLLSVWRQRRVRSVDGSRGDRKEGGKRGRKPGRKPDKVDMKAKLERSRQSARECRARKKLRYQYLEELVADREKAVFALRKELEKYKQWSKDLDEGKMPEGMEALLEEVGKLKQEK